MLGYLNDVKIVLVFLSDNHILNDSIVNAGEGWLVRCSTILMNLMYSIGFLRAAEVWFFSIYKCYCCVVSIDSIMHVNNFISFLMLLVSFWLRICTWYCTYILWFHQYSKASIFVNLVKITVSRIR